METSPKYISMIDRLQVGEKVECEECHKGHLEPLNPKAKINHSYICNYCGAHYHWDPVVIVE